MRFLRVLAGAILLILLIVFAVANRQTVAVSLEPLPFLIDLPLYLLVFLVFFTGLLLGALADRLNAWGSARRRRAAEAAKAKERAAATQTLPATTTTTAGELPPAPPL